MAVLSGGRCSGFSGAMTGDFPHRCIAIASHPYRFLGQATGTTLSRRLRYADYCADLDASSHGSWVGAEHLDAMLAAQFDWAIDIREKCPRISTTTTDRRMLYGVHYMNNFLVCMHLFLLSSSHEGIRIHIATTSSPRGWLDSG